MLEPGITENIIRPQQPINHPPYPRKHLPRYVAHGGRQPTDRIEQQRTRIRFGRKVRLGHDWEQRRQVLEVRIDE
jgi:hypothetical protein